jgi:hypothetical protein
MSFNKTTSVTQTGLGDDQYQQLQTNQEGLGTQIEEGFTGADARFDTVGTGISGLGTQLDAAGDTITSGFTNLNTYLDNQFTTSGANQAQLAQNQVTGFSDLYDQNRENFDSLTTDFSGLQGSVDEGFMSAGSRFDDIDAASQNIQQDVTTGFSDQAQSFTDANNTMTTNTSDIRDDITNNFDATNKSLSDAQTSLQGDIATSQSEVLGGQGGLASSLSDLSATNDTYFGTLSENQANMQSGQDSFRTTFDDYVDRYSDDVTLANQTRADLQLAQSNATKALQNDIGSYAQAAAQGQDLINRNLGTLGEGSARGFEVLADTVQGGFSETTAANQLQDQNLTSRIGNVKSLLETTGDNIDASTRSQYAALANSFDENGQLIANSVDAQGNTISRAMDDQGLIIETKFDGAGNEIGKVQMDVETMLSNAEKYQSSLTGQISGLQDVTEGGFTGVGDALGTGFADTEREITSIGRGQQDLADTVQTGQQGLMAETANTQDMLDSASQQLRQGFDETTGTLDVQTRDLANISSGQSDLDMRMRQDFKQVSEAFDDQGQLITNTVTENGTTISRAVDESGNLILRAFDAQGNRIGDKVLNINRTLFDLQNMQTQVGGNVSMGNLSAPMQGDVPTSGFASPFTTTR